MDFRIDDLARRLLESVPPAFRGMQQDLESNFRAVLRANLELLFAGQGIDSRFAADGLSGLQEALAEPPEPSRAPPRSLTTTLAPRAARSSA